MELRPYQLEAIESIQLNENANCTRGLIVLPTGTGKTVVFSSLPYFRPNSFPMLVLAHREELLEQAKDKITSLFPNISVHIEQGKNHAPADAEVVIASVPTLGKAGSKRINKFAPDYFKVVIIDEAHHAAAPTYRRVVDYFKSSMLLGFTATPQRGDKTRLTDVFDKIFYFKSIIDMIKEKWLVPLRGYRVETNLDITGVKSRSGDYVVDELAEAVNVDARNDLIIEIYNEYGQDRKAIVFCVDVKHAYTVRDKFRDAGKVSECIVGSTDPEERKQILQDFHDGKVKVLTNCEVLTEGFDSPEVSLIIMARPTKSQLLYTQAVGRGTRLAENKEDCLVFDIVDVSKGARPQALPTLMGLPPEFDLEGNTILEAYEAFEKLKAEASSELAHVRSLSDIQVSFEKIDIFKMPEPNLALLTYSSFIWNEVSVGYYYLGLGDGESINVRTNALGTFDIKFQKHDKADLLSSQPSIEEAFEYADKWIKENKFSKLKLLYNDSEWRQDPPTEKQLKWLRKHGVPITKELTKGHASFILDKIFAKNPRPPKPAWLEAKIKREKEAQTYGYF